MGIPTQGGRPISEINSLMKLCKEIVDEDIAKGMKGRDLKNDVVSKMMNFVSVYTAQKYFMDVMSGYNEEVMKEQKKSDEQFKKKLEESELEKNRLKQRLKEISDELSG